MLKNVKDIGSGAYHSVALMEDGSVYTWGKNHHGQLGIGMRNNSTQFVPKKSIIVGEC